MAKIQRAVALAIVCVAINVASFSPRHLYRLSSRGRICHDATGVCFPAHPATYQRCEALQLSALGSVAPLLRGGDADFALDLIDDAYTWCTNLGAPAALVAGAVVATLYETMRAGDLEPQVNDGKWVALAKKLTRLLLLSAFALEVMSIFVTTVTGTMLYSRTVPVMQKVRKVTAGTTALSFLRDNFEFESLTASISFLQGLLNWLAAIGLSHAIPAQDENKSTRRVNRFVAASLWTTILVMLKFYNSHLTFYANYGVMLKKWFVLTCTKFVFVWPLKPLTYLLLPSLAATLYTGFVAFLDDTHVEKTSD